MRILACSSPLLRFPASTGKKLPAPYFLQKQQEQMALAIEDQCTYNGPNPLSHGGAEGGAAALNFGQERKGIVCRLMNIVAQLHT